MNTLSIAIATRNEEENIEKCLRSLNDWVTEIVVVDGASEDKTEEICQKFKVRLLKEKNEKMFHLNKQKAIEACKGDWILQLDADEIVSKDLREEITHVINSSTTTHKSQPVNGYWIPRRNFFLGRFLKKGGQYPDYTLRLYRRNKGRLPCKSVHEQAQVDGKTSYLKNPLLHYPYPDFSHYLDHFNLYTTIAADELKEKNVSFSFYNFILYFIIKPKFWFVLTFLRHKGYIDGFSGFVFSLFSALRFPVSFVKYWEMVKVKK